MESGVEGGDRRFGAGIPDDLIQRIIGLRRDGLSAREIGRKTGLDKSTVLKYIKRYQPGCVRGEPPPAIPIGKVIDRTDVDGSVEVLKMDRPATVEEIAEMCGLDRRVWVPQYFRPNLWQGFYKLKNYLPRPLIEKLASMVKGGSTVDEISASLESSQDGHQKVQLYQSRASFKRIMAEEVEEAILQFVRDNVGPIRARPPRSKPRTGEYMVAWGLWDAHLGMYAWNSEVGSDFDVSIAKNRILNSIDDMVGELGSYPIERIVMPVGNDVYHFDSVRHKTAFGEHFLDTDSRYAKVFLTGLECLSYMVERALALCDRVELLYIPGNHDTTSSFCLCAALQQRFRNDSRVKVDLGANPRKYVVHGGTLLGFDHGAEKNRNQLAMIFSTEAKEHWSNSTYREIQIGHTHQRAGKEYEGVIPTNGVLIRTNPALTNNDFWHHSRGLIGEPVKSVEAWRYDKVGFRGSHVTWAREQER